MDEPRGSEYIRQLNEALAEHAKTIEALHRRNDELYAVELERDERCAEAGRLRVALEGAVEGLRTTLMVIAVTQRENPIGDEEDFDQMVLDGQTLLTACERALEGKDAPR